MTGWIQDLLYALRSLRREPGYALCVVATLALGIGACVAVFSVVNRVLLTALPYDQSDRLIAIWGRFLPESGFDLNRFPLSNPEFVDYRAESQSLAGVGAWQSSSATVGAAGEDPERVTAAAVTPDLFPVLGARPRLGRGFSETEGRPGAPGVVILSFPFWQSRFGGRDDVVGKSVIVNGTTRIVVGVMPEGFDMPAGVRLWTPLPIDAANPGNRKNHSISAIGRLKDGVTFEAARSEMNTLMRGWRDRYPTVHTGHFLYLTPLLDDTVGGVGPILGLLLAATALLFLIVCANVISLMLARAERRAREVAIRMALGSGRWRLVRLAALESSLLALSGGLGGASLAAGAVSWLRGAEGVSLPRLAEVTIDQRAWLVTATLSALVACLLSLLPALRTATSRIATSLRLDARTGAGTGRTWVGRSLVTLEVALAVVLVAGAALLVQSFTRLLHVDPGVRTDRILLANISLPRVAYADPGRADGFFDQAISRLSALPGVRLATASTNLPLVSSLGVWDFEIEHRQKPGEGQPAWNAPPMFVRAGFLEAVGARLVRGRFFADDDRLGREPVALISEAFARSFFGGDDPIGSRLRVSGGTNQYARIIGVVGDIRDQSLEQAPRPMYFMAQAQAVATTGDAIRQATFVLRSDRDPSLLGAALRAVIREVDPSLPVYAVRTYEGAVAQSVARPRFATLLLAVFAAFGLGLGWLGVYGVLAYTVAERTVELGIRRALGAPSSGLIRLVLVQGLRPVFVGVGAGLLTAAAASGVLRAQLFGVSPTDPATYVVVATGVLAAALLACMTPTLRALRVSPLAALRDR